MNVSENLITVLVFSGLLTVPSVVFAEASWYGSLRGGITFGGDKDAEFADHHSRWGVKGSNEVSEGLSADYRFEHKVSTKDASLSGGGRLAYVGLTGGFGTVTLGQIWSASYNAIGGIADLPASFYSLYTNTHTTYRHGNVVSYSVSAGGVSLQMDAMMDGAKDTDSAIDKFEFGLTFDLSDNFKVAVAHINQRDEMGDMYYRLKANTDVKAEKIMVKVAKDHVAFTNAGLRDAGMPAANPPVAATGVVRDDAGKYSIGTCNAMDADATNACEEREAFVSVRESVPTGGGMESVSYAYHVADDVESHRDTTKGSKANHAAIQVSLGGVTGYVSHAQIEKNDSNMKSKVTRYGVSGPIGDDGLNFYVAARSEEMVGMPKDSPWLAGITKSLGDGALGIIEYADVHGDDSGTMHLALKVDF